MNQTIFLKSPGYPEGVGVSPLGGHRGKQNFSVTKGKLLGIATKLPTKSRQANSSVGYFDLNGKTILSYNLKHYLRLTTELQKTHSKATPSEAKLSNALRSGAPCEPLKDSSSFIIGSRHKIVSLSVKICVSNVSKAVAPIFFCFIFYA